MPSTTIYKLKTNTYEKKIILSSLTPIAYAETNILSDTKSKIILENNCLQPVTFTYQIIDGTSGAYKIYPNEIKMMDKVFDGSKEYGQDVFFSYSVTGDYITGLVGFNIRDLGTISPNKATFQGAENVEINHRRIDGYTYEYLWDRASQKEHIIKNSTHNIIYNNFNKNDNENLGYTHTPWPTFTISSCPIKYNIDGSDFLKDVKHVVLFGDSLSDNGKSGDGKTGGSDDTTKINSSSAYDISGYEFPTSTPYATGQFSNGDVWSQIIGNKLAENGITMHNYAIGGATASHHPNWIRPIAPITRKLWEIDLTDEAVSYIAELQKSDERHEAYANDNKLGIIFIGGNDYSGACTNYSSDCKTITDITKATDTVKKAITDHIDKVHNLEYLKNKYSKIDKFILVGLPDISVVTASREEYHNEELVRELVIKHNQNLQDIADDPKYSSYVTYIPLWDMFDYLLYSTNDFNKTYGTNFRASLIKSRCYTGGYVAKESDLEKICSDPSEYVFWDNVHPTRDTHRALAKYMAEQLGLNPEYSNKKR